MKEEALTVRVESKFKEEIVEMAQRLDIPISQLIRAALKAYVKRERDINGGVN